MPSTDRKCSVAPVNDITCTEIKAAARHGKTTDTLFGQACRVKQHKTEEKPQILLCLREGQVPTIETPAPAYLDSVRIGVRRDAVVTEDELLGNDVELVSRHVGGQLVVYHVTRHVIGDVSEVVEGQHVEAVA